MDKYMAAMAELSEPVLCTVGDFISAPFYSTKKLKLTLKVQNGLLLPQIHPGRSLECWWLGLQKATLKMQNIRNRHKLRPDDATLCFSLCTYNDYGPNKNVHSRKWPERATVPIKYCYRLWVIYAFGFHQQLKLVWPHFSFSYQDYSMQMLLYPSLYRNSQGL